MTSPMVIKHRGLSLQVCVPQDWKDKQIVDFAEASTPCGTENGWQVREEGDAALLGTPARNPCASFDDFVHVVLDA
jgi:hypothetical protein